ncbi:MAG: NlpC/P60 family protein [Bacteroidetes bacterium]|nr:NlpC/P60 family protein [Bacteroidota bacterium]
MARIFYLLILTIGLTGCTTSRSIFDRRLGDDDGVAKVGDPVSETPSSDEATTEDSGLSLYMEFEQALRTELAPWHGVPHMLGGTARTGVDCSGLIVRVFGDLLSLQTGRTTEQLIQEGQHVSKRQLRAGDLVFFSPTGSKKGSHVGIFLSDHEFTHASSSKGVMTSSLTESYWTRFYETSRRIIPGEEWLRASITRIRERQALSRVLQSE